MELCNKDAEADFLSCIFVNQDILAETSLTQEDFADYRFGITFKAMKDLYERDVDVNTTTVHQALSRTNITDITPMIGYLVSRLPHSSTWRDIQTVILEFSKRRQVTIFCDNLSKEIGNLSNDLKETLGKYSEEFSNAMQDKEVACDFVSTRDMVMSSWEDLLTPENKGVQTGFEVIDRFIRRGMRPGDLVILAARPSMGKTALALNIADNITTKTGTDVLFFSLETTAQTMVQRLLLSRACVSRNKLESGTATDDEQQRFTQAASALFGQKTGQIHISEKSGMMVEDMMLDARKFMLKNKDRKVSLVIIDHLQLIRSRNKYGRIQEITEISGKLKWLAKMLNCPVLCLSQLSRASESRQDHTPVMSDLRESGSIEQDADIIMMLYRKAYYSKDPNDDSADVIFAKNKEGELGVAKMMFLGQFMKFQAAPKEWELMSEMGTEVSEREVPK